jgi:hypothetical protein
MQESGMRYDYGVTVSPTKVREYLPGIVEDHRAGLLSCLDLLPAYPHLFCENGISYSYDATSD